MSEPRTEAGKRLLAALFDEGDWPDEPITCILAIEAEARSEGLDALREALGELVDALTARPDTDTRDHPEQTHEDVELAWSRWDVRIQRAIDTGRLALSQHKEPRPTWCIAHKAYDHCEDAALAALSQHKEPHHG